MQSLPPSSDPNRDLIHNLETVVEQFRQKLAEEVQGIESELRKSYGDLDQQVEVRKRLALRLEISKHLIQVYDEGKWGEPWLQDAERSEEKDIDETVSIDVLGFSLKGKRYNLKINRDFSHSVVHDDAPMPYHEVPGEIALLSKEGRLLYQAGIVEQVDAEFPARWFKAREGTDSIYAFVPGDWVSDFVALSERIAVHCKQEQLKYKLGDAARMKLRENFGLEGTE